MIQAINRCCSIRFFISWWSWMKSLLVCSVKNFLWANRVFAVPADRLGWNYFIFVMSLWYIGSFLRAFTLCLMWNVFGGQNGQIAPWAMDLIKQWPKPIFPRYTADSDKYVWVNMRWNVLFYREMAETSSLWSCWRHPLNENSATDKRFHQSHTWSVDPPSIFWHISS